MSTNKIQYSILPQQTSFSEVHCLDGGSFIASWSVIHANAGEDSFRLYNWAYHIHDVETDRHILWDVGMSSNPADYPPWSQKFMASLGAVGPRISLERQLALRKIEKGQIQSIIFSHAHWDHCRPMSREFPSAKLYVGPGTKSFCGPGHFEDPENVQWDGRLFDPVRATENVEELKGPWVRLGAFEKAYDFFGTGSFWIIQAPGHMPGNLCALACVGKDEWILLGSDCCHSRALLDGEHEFAVWKAPDGSTASLQADIIAARDTIARIRVMESQLGCHVALAHDTEWMKQGKDQVLMKILNEELRDATTTRLISGEVV